MKIIFVFSPGKTNLSNYQRVNEWLFSHCRRKTEILTVFEVGERSKTGCIIYFQTLSKRVKFVIEKNGIEAKVILNWTIFECYGNKLYNKKCIRSKINCYMQSVHQILNKICVKL